MIDRRLAEDVLYAFSVEPKHDRQTLENYLRRYPELAEELIDLSHELRLVAELGESEVPTDAPVTVCALSDHRSGHHNPNARAACRCGVKRVVEGSSVDLAPGDIVTLLQLAAPGRETDGGKSDGGKRDE